MAVPQKYKRLLEATQRFNSFNRFVDVVTVVLFAFISVAVANKVLPKKVVNSEILDCSWETIGFCALVFAVLFSAQVTKMSYRRELSAFEREATLKAARKNRYRRHR